MLSIKIQSETCYKLEPFIAFIDCSHMFQDKAILTMWFEASIVERSSSGLNVGQRSLCLVLRHSMSIECDRSVRRVVLTSGNAQCV